MCLMEQLQLPDSEWQNIRYVLFLLKIPNETTRQITRRPQTEANWNPMDLLKKNKVHQDSRHCNKGIEIPAASIKSSAIQQQWNQMIQFWISSRKMQEIQMQTFWRTADRLLVAEKKKTPHSPVKIVASVQAE